MDVGERICQTERRKRRTNQASHLVVMEVDTVKIDNRQSGRRKSGEISDDGGEGLCDECPMWTVGTVMVNGGNEKDRRLAKQAMVGVIDWVATRDSSTGIA